MCKFGERKFRELLFRVAKHFAQSFVHLARSKIVSRNSHSHRAAPEYPPEALLAYTQTLQGELLGCYVSKKDQGVEPAQPGEQRDSKFDQKLTAVAPLAKGFITHGLGRAFEPAAI